MDFVSDKFSVLQIREKERRRIAEDLHDVTLQHLSHLIHKIELSSLYIDQDQTKAKLELATVEQNLRQIISDMRTIIYDLNPMSIEDLGIKETMERTLTIMNQEQKFSIENDIEDVSCENKIILISIYRLAKECCYNAIKHSNGDKLSISLKQDDQKILLKIKDNGIGFREEEICKKSNHFGLYIVKERVCLLNGKINIDSSQNGTSVEIEIPIQSNITENL